MTNEDLKEMQKWPLERKIRVSQCRIMEWYQHWEGKVYISFSGGKDSTVLLDLARRIYPEIEAVFADTGLEYPEVRSFVKSKENVTIVKPKMRFDEVIEKYGYPVISKENSQKIYEIRNTNSQKLLDIRLYGSSNTNSGKLPEKWKYLIDAPFKISEKCCNVMKKNPMREFQKKTGKNPIIGTMASESYLRKTDWVRHGCNAFDANHPSSKPLSFWTEQDILEYLKTTKLDYCSVYGEIKEHGQEATPFMQKKLYTTGLERTGCMFCMFGCHLEKEPNRFQKMKLTHPKQYDYCINKMGCGRVLEFIGVAF